MGGRPERRTRLWSASLALKGGEPQFVIDYADYYQTPRGDRPCAVNSGNAWTQTNSLSFMNFPLMTDIADLAPPILIIHGECAQRCT